MDSRLEYIKPSKYSNKVLIGPWYYNRDNTCHRRQETFKNATTYDIDYCPKPVKKPDYTLMWDQILDAETSGFVSDLEGFKLPNYYNNFSTSYDLSYNLFPKCYGSYIPRTWEFIKGCHIPHDEYLPTFGNITKSGLLEQKNIEWNFDDNDPRRPTISSYQCEFKAPNFENYDFKIFVTGRAALKSSECLSEEDLKSFRENTKCRPVRDVVSSTLLCAHKEKYCNPITWECTPDVKKIEPRRCVQ